MKDYANILFPFCELIREKRWSWNKSHQDVFVKLKELLTEESLLYHYAIGREQELLVDASLTGLRAVLAQRLLKIAGFRAGMLKSGALKDPETHKRSLGHTMGYEEI